MSVSKRSPTMRISHRSPEKHVYRHIYAHEYIYSRKTIHVLEKDVPRMSVSNWSPTMRTSRKSPEKPQKYNACI